MTIELTKEQEAQIYCVKHGHANYVWSFFGYVHCGRCSQQIGDQLAGVFDTRGMIVPGHDCEVCNTLKKTLSPLDKKILKRLEKTKDKLYDYEKILKRLENTKDKFYKYEKILRGISLND